jgi:hypothetical protein
MPDKNIFERGFSSVEIEKQSESLTTSESQAVVKDLKLELEKVKKDIESRGIGNVSIDFLNTKKDFLQSKLNELLKKGGVITEEDYNDTYKIIRSKEENELKNLYKKANRRVVIFFGLAIATIVGIYLLSKKK